MFSQSKNKSNSIAKKIFLKNKKHKNLQKNTTNNYPILDQNVQIYQQRKSKSKKLLAIKHAN